MDKVCKSSLYKPQTDKLFCILAARVHPSGYNCVYRWLWVSDNIKFRLAGGWFLFSVVMTTPHPPPHPKTRTGFRQWLSETSDFGHHQWTTWRCPNNRDGQWSCVRRCSSWNQDRPFASVLLRL